MAYPKVRGEFANHVRLSNEAKASAKAKEHSFAEEISSKNHRHAEWSHHANPRKGRKEVTVTQANRLAKYASTIQDCSKKYGVPVPLICGVILQESGGNPKAVSPAGARGIRQLMPATARRFGVKNILVPAQNIEGGVKYLRFLMDRFSNDYKLVCAGYNAGEHNVEKYGFKVPPFAETRNYVPNVLAYADTIHQLLGGTNAIAPVTEPKNIQLNPILPHYKRV